MADAVVAEVPFDGALLEKSLQGTPPEREDPDDEDPRLNIVADHVTKGAYEQAARTAEALLRDSIFDVRIIGPYLFGSFVEQGLKAMPRIFRSVIQSLTENWEKLVPLEKRALLANNGLRWLFKTMSRHLLHHEKLKDEEWKRWREPSNRAPIEEALSLGDPLLAACSKSLPAGDCEQSVRPILSWLQQHLSAVPAEASPAEEAPLADVPDSDEEPEEELNEDPEAKEPAPETQRRPAAARTRAPSSAAAPGLPISPAMELLLRKLQAFDTLVSQQDFLKAGIVAADVLGTIERFDPRIYMPTIFARFFSGLSTHAETLEPMLHNTESLAFRSLDQLYRVDLDAFLAQQSQGQGKE
jgi:hypothetical protein